MRETPCPRDGHLRSQGQDQSDKVVNTDVAWRCLTQMNMHTKYELSTIKFILFFIEQNARQSQTFFTYFL